ncbi:DEKNAAC100312 [Brettanomyces naardenensis]|uniref:DEKNAAC100312 n=1 Tax=Brettanomyces naardenensis TaxID=13370 RepID=A0A448YF41_BRENA|nr:DEKNAAC100312 [Brettanomyces naardenensis]
MSLLIGPSKESKTQPGEDGYIAEIEDDQSSSTIIDFEVGNVHRRLSRRQIELIAIGGTIGVSLFVNIGTSLKEGGPLSLLLGFTLWCVPILEITSCCAEMVCYLPIRGAPFCIFADRFVDEAFGVMASWNFWVLECALIPFELTLFNTLIHYWATNYSAAIPLAVELVVYFLINAAAVRWYGEAEFWLCMGKVLLAVGLMVFTFVSMVGGNPQHDHFGFRNWKDSPVMLEYITNGPLGRFEGFLACLISGAYMIAGPEYLSMAAGETVNPRQVLPGAFKGVFFRLTTFFIGGALCVGILCNARDPLLLNAIAEGKPGAGASPYTIAMYNMGIKVLPSILNAMLLTSCFSAGNSYTYCSSRTLYGLAKDGRAPKLFSYCNKQGVPIYAVILSLCWGCLGFLQLNENANTVLNWIINLITASQLINYCVILFTYLHFRRAVIAQGLDRSKFTFKAWFQPWSCAITFAVVLIMVGVQGYTVFLPGGWWSVETFLFSYLMCFVDIAIFVAWKLIRRTKYKRNPKEVDLVTGLEEVEMHEKLLQRQKLVRPNRSSAYRFFSKVNKILFGAD